MNRNGYSATFQKDIESEFKKLEYPSSKMEGPICSKKIQKCKPCFIEFIAALNAPKMIKKTALPVFVLIASSSKTTRDIIFD
jgi:hypothetical protein